MGQFLTNFRDLFLLALQAAFAAMAVVTFLEYAFPDGTKTSVRSRVHGAVLRFLFIGVGTVCQALAVVTIQQHPIQP
ncbi:MAG: hypothetical protein ACREFC_00840, partial [Stellaceae bacterium]